jgi:hypothetical protein
VKTHESIAESLRSGFATLFDRAVEVVGSAVADVRDRVVLEGWFGQRMSSTSVSGPSQQDGGSRNESISVEPEGPRRIARDVAVDGRSAETERRDPGFSELLNGIRAPDTSESMRSVQEPGLRASWFRTTSDQGEVGFSRSLDQLREPADQTLPSLAEDWPDRTHDR